MAYIATVKQEIAHRGWPKDMGNNGTAINQQARTICPNKGSSGSQGVRIIQGGQDVAIGPQGRRYGRTWQNRGFSSY